MLSKEKELEHTNGYACSAKRSSIKKKMGQIIVNITLVSAWLPLWLRTRGVWTLRPRSGSVFLDESSEVWCDTDDFMMEGLKEDEAMMEEFPDGYQWSCCEQQYDAAPCRTAAHTQYPGKENNDKTISQQKRARDEEENEARKERKI